MVTEMVFSAAFLVYCIIGVVYSIKVEKDKHLMLAYGTTCRHKWSEKCFRMGFLWPIYPLLNFVKRSKYETRRIY